MLVSSPRGIPARFWFKGVPSVGVLGVPKVVGMRQHGQVSELVHAPCNCHYLPLHYFHHNSLSPLILPYPFCSLKCREYSLWWQSVRKNSSSPCWTYNFIHLVFLRWYCILCCLPCFQLLFQKEDVCYISIHVHEKATLHICEFLHFRLIRLTSPNLNYMIESGAILLYVAIVLTVLPATTSNAAGVLCNLTVWLTAFGYSLCYGTILMKMLRMYHIFNNPSTQKKKVDSFWAIKSVMQRVHTFRVRWDESHWGPRLLCVCGQRSYNQKSNISVAARWG